MNNEIKQKLVTAYELSGTPLSPVAIVEVVKMLDKEDPKYLSEALDLCIREVKGKLALSDIYERIARIRERPVYYREVAVDRLLPEYVNNDPKAVSEMIAKWREKNGLSK